MPTQQSGQDAPSPEQSSAESGRVWPTQDHSWSLQQLHHIGRDVGKLQEAVDTLKNNVGKQGDAITGVKRTIHLATGFIICAGIIGSLLLGLIAWLVEKGFDRLVEVLAKVLAN